MTPARIAKRILFRIEAGSTGTAGLAAAARLAAAFHAELAARLISDTRFAAALSAPAFSTGRGHNGGELHTIVRRSETRLRRTLSEIPEFEHTVWSFEVVECAGVLSECGAEPDDIVAIELAKLELASDVRAETERALSTARGVVLFPALTHASEGPVVAVAPDADRIPEPVEALERIAAALATPLVLIDIAPNAAAFAAEVRSRRAALAIVNAHSALAAEFLARPRFLRELGSPLLLLKP